MDTLMERAGMFASTSYSFLQPLIRRLSVSTTQDPHLIRENSTDLPSLNEIDGLICRVNNCNNILRGHANNLKANIKELENKIESLKCIICFERQRNIMAIPCGHVFYCDICANEYDQYCSERQQPILCHPNCNLNPVSFFSKIFIN